MAKLERCVMDCPSEQDLIAYAHGELDFESNIHIDLHLRQCEVCNDAISWFQQHLQAVGAEESSREDLLSESSLNEDSEPESGEVWLDRAKEKFNFSNLDEDSRSDILGRLGRFDVLSLIGVGGMGVVFRCFDRDSEQTVAVKVLAEALARDDESRERFRREAKAAAKLRHDNVVEVYGSEEIDGHDLLVMEFVDGVTLRRLVRKQGPLSVEWSIDIAVQIARGLAASHDCGVVHRDVKPGNIILTDRADVKLTDFGLARVALEDSQLTKSGVMVGTPAYMAPEQVVMETVDGRADLFSLGCVLYFMLTGKSPFQGATSAEMAYRVVHEEPEPLSEAAPHCPAALSDLVGKLLAKTPERRIASASELIRLLEEVDPKQLPRPSQAGSSTRAGSVVASKASSRKPDSRDSARRNWLLLGGVGVIVLGALLILAFMFVRSGPKKGDRDNSVEKQMGPQLLKVGPGQPYTTIQDALDSASSGDTVLLPDAHQMAGPILLGEKHQGVVIDFQGSTLVAGPDAATLIRIASGARIHIRNVVLKPNRMQHAIAVYGDATGLKIENIRAFAAADATKSLVSIERRALGSPRSPLVIERCQFQGGGIGVALGDNEICGRILISRCWFRQMNTAIRVAAPAEKVDICDNVFLDAKLCVALHLRQAGTLNEITIKNNTMARSECWFAIEDRLERYDEDIQLQQNLIVDSQRVAAPTTNEGIRFIDNYWRATRGQRVEVEPFAFPLSGPVLDLREDAETFMHPLPSARDAFPMGLRIGAPFDEESNGIDTPDFPGVDN